MAGIDCCGVWTFIICSLSGCACTTSMEPWGTLQPLASGSPYFHLTVILSRLGQVSRNFTSSRSCSCRTSQHHWFPQKMETYFLASKVWNWDGKISANSVHAVAKDLPKASGSHSNYFTLCMVSSHPCGKESAVQKALRKQTQAASGWPRLDPNFWGTAEEPLEMEMQTRNP